MTARTADAMISSPTSGMVSTEIFSPRMLWRSASVTAPSATWAICAPPPTMITRLPKTLSIGRVLWIATTSRSGWSAAMSVASSASSTSTSTSAWPSPPSASRAAARRIVVRERRRPPTPATAAAIAATAPGSSVTDRRAAVVGGRGFGLRRGIG